MRLTALFLAAILAGCAQPAATPAGSTNELAGRVAGPPQSCVAALSGQNLRPLDSSTIAYGHGQTIYVNHLGAPCPGVGDLNTLIVDVQGSQYCRGDRIRGLEPGAIIPGPTCVLGNWTPYRLH